MTKSGILVTLLSVWLFAIFAPSVISLLENDGKSIVTITLNEEEQQKQGTKNINEKLAVESNVSDFSLLALLQNSISYDCYLSGNSDHTSEIVLPPPEQIT